MERKGCLLFVFWDFMMFEAFFFFSLHSMIKFLKFLLIIFLMLFPGNFAGKYQILQNNITLNKDFS